MKIIKIFKLIVKTLRHIFVRKKFVEYNFYAGTSNVKESFIILSSLFRFEPIKNGKWIREYEKNFADYLGVKHSFSFATGRMGLYVILKALGLKERDEIIIPGYTCVVVPNAIIYAGVKPVYVDINEYDFNINAELIESKITNKTRAIYAQHTFGLMCDIDKILKIADKYQIPVIEDCCIALGAEHKGKKAGTFGKVAYFSTDHSKVISTASGGMVVTDDEILAEKIRGYYKNSHFCGNWINLRILFTFIMESILRKPQIYFLGKYVLFWLSKFRLLYYFSDYLAVKKPDKYPFPARLSNLQAKIGLHQLKKLNDIVRHHKETAMVYDEEIGRYNKYFNEKKGEHMFLRYVFLAEDPGYIINKTGKYIELENWFYSVTQGRKSDFHEVYYSPGACPVAERVSRHVINLPTNMHVKKPPEIINIIKSALKIDSLKEISISRIKF